MGEKMEEILRDIARMMWVRLSDQERQDYAEAWGIPEWALVKEDTAELEKSLEEVL